MKLRKISEGKKVIGIPNSVLENKNIENKIKTLIVKSLAESVVLCGVHSWTSGRPEANKTLTAEMDFWQRTGRK